MLITINNKQLRLKFGMWVAKHIEPIMLDEHTYADRTTELILRAHENYVRANVSEVQAITRQELYAAIEDGAIVDDKDIMATVAAVWKAFYESEIMKTALKRAEEIIAQTDEPKKKVARGKK
jgi:hypothetical protein